MQYLLDGGAYIEKRLLEEASVTIEEITIKNSSSINNKLTFNDHVSKLCQKAKQKIHALARASNCISKEKLRILMDFSPL